MRTERPEPIIVKASSAVNRQTIYIVQPFEERKKGRQASIAPAAPLAARDRNHALLLLERATFRTGIVGAVAFSREGNPEIGEYDEPVIIGQVGRVPELME